MSERVCSNGSQIRLRPALAFATGLAMMTVMLLSSRAFAQDPGTAQAWGSNLSGQLGDGTLVNRTTPVPVSGLAGVIGVAAGDVHSLALLSDGTVMAWGYNNHGQLGDGTIDTPTRPVPASGLANVIGLSAGGYHSLAMF
jgi:alpha-tubulin suppressor-like RCC1 family protein